jgi:hypothetical protein
MTPWPEVTVNDAMCRSKSLRLIGRLEARHLAFSSSRRPMRVFRSIVQLAAGPVSDIGQNSALRNAIAAQAVGDHTLRFVLQAFAAGA